MVTSRLNKAFDRCIAAEARVDNCLVSYTVLFQFILIRERQAHRHIKDSGPRTQALADWNRPPPAAATRYEKKKLTAPLCLAGNIETTRLIRVASVLYGYKQYGYKQDYGRYLESNNSSNATTAPTIIGKSKRTEILLRTWNIFCAYISKCTVYRMSPRIWTRPFLQYRGYRIVA